MAKKILLVIDNLGSGGAQRQIVNLAVVLKKAGYDVSLFIYHNVMHFAKELSEAEVPLFCFPKDYKYTVSPIFKLRCLVKNKSFQVVIAFLETPSFYAEIATIGIRNVKLIVSERSMYPDGALPIKLYLLQELHRLANRITVNSDHQRKSMVKRFPWMKEKVSTIYNGYDLGKYAQNQSCDEVSNHYLAIASIAQKKNSMHLAQALKMLRDVHKLDVKISWVGIKTVAIEGDATFRQTDDYLKQNGLSDCWQWLGVRNDIPALLNSCKALIHPSYFEGLPNVICEALASSKPVLASNVCDHPILIDEPMRGFLFDPASPESIAETIVRFEKLSKCQVEEMGKNSRNYALANLSIDVFAAKYRDLIES